MLSNYTLERLERLTVLYDILDKKSMSKISGFNTDDKDESTVKEDCKLLLLNNIKNILLNGK